LLKRLKPTASLQKYFFDFRWLKHKKPKRCFAGRLIDMG